MIGVILAIVALASQKDEVAQNPTPSPGASAAPPGAAPSSAADAARPLPSATAGPERDGHAGPEHVPDARPERDPVAGGLGRPEPTETVDPRHRDVPGFTGTDGDYTVIIESASPRRRRPRRSPTRRRARASTDVGILNSDDYSSLNGGYYVVFVGAYTSKSDAEDALDGIKSDYPDAYVRKISA